MVNLLPAKVVRFKHTRNYCVMIKTFELACALDKLKITLRPSKQSL